MKKLQNLVKDTEYLTRLFSLINVIKVQHFQKCFVRRHVFHMVKSLALYSIIMLFHGIYFTFLLLLITFYAYIFPFESTIQKTRKLISHLIQLIMTTNFCN